MNNSSKRIWKTAKGKIILVSVFTAGLAAFIINIQSIVGLFQRKGLQIVDISFYKNDSLDVKLTNTGSEVAILKKVTLHFKKSWRLEPDEVTKSFLTASGTYDIAIDCTKDPPFNLATNISQSLNGNESDRLFIHIGLGKIDIDKPGSVIYLADLEIIYGAKDKKLRKKDIFLLIPDNDAIYNPKSTNGNSEKLLEVKKTGGIASKELEDLFVFFGQ
jgi:hypothetical protein